MRILFHVHGYPPIHNAGAEMMAHGIARSLVARGHEVQVITNHNMLGGPARGDVDGIPVICNLPGMPAQRELYGWAEVVVTHLDLTRRVVAWAGEAARPVVQIVHNPWSLTHWGQTPATVDLAVFNSRWLQRLHRWPGRQTVVYPPVALEEYQTEPAGEWITLLNLNANKGAELFWEVARRMPERLFLGVRGCYGDQIVYPCPNVLIQEHTRHVREQVYARTAILLVPSQVETFGRVAVEAACSGIPTICHPTEGLQEALDGLGLWADRTDPEAWVEAIRKLDNPITRAHHGSQLYRRAQELERIYARQLEGLELALEATLHARQRVRRIHFMAAERHYLAHLAPVWKALPAQHRGQIMVPLSLLEHAEREQVPVTPVLDPAAKTDLRQLVLREPAAVVVASILDLQRAEREGMRCALLEHGAGQTYNGPAQSYAGGMGRERLLAYLAPGEHPAEKHRAVYSGHRVEAIGSPWLDRFFARPPYTAWPDKPVIAVSFHWPCALFPETFWTWPFFREELERIARFGRWQILGHGHPRAWDKLEGWWKGLGVEPVEDFEEICRRASLYCVDNSSTAYEFAAATGRPVVLMNSPSYRRHVDHGLRFWDAIPGLQVDRPEDLEAVWELALTDPPEAKEARTEALRKVYWALDGRASERAANILVEVTKHMGEQTTDPKDLITMRATDIINGIEVTGGNIIKPGEVFAPGYHHFRRPGEPGLQIGPRVLTVDPATRASKLSSNGKAVYVNRPAAPTGKAATKMVAPAEHPEKNVVASGVKVDHAGATGIAAHPARVLTVGPTDALPAHGTTVTTVKEEPANAVPAYVAAPSEPALPEEGLQPMAHAERTSNPITGKPPDPAPLEKDELATGTTGHASIECPDCEPNPTTGERKRFGSLGALKIHAAKIHGKKK